MFPYPSLEVCKGGTEVDSSWNMMAHGDAWEGNWSENWRMEWVASTLHTISEHGVSSITTSDAHTSAASSRLNWSSRRFKWTRPFRRKTKSGFCACAITFQLAPTAAFILNLGTRWRGFVNSRAPVAILPGNNVVTHWRRRMGGHQSRSWGLQQFQKNWTHGGRPAYCVTVTVILAHWFS